MKSELPKGLFPVAGVPMAQLIGRAMQGAGVERPVVVVGYGGELLKNALGDSFEYVWQTEQLGTGHAALMAEPVLADKQGPVLITPGDTPLISSEMLAQLLETHTTTRAECTLATVRLPDPFGYGRIVRDAHNRVRRIVEERDASPRERQIQEVCTSVYCINAPTLFGFLPRLGNRNAQGEYYLTDIVEAIYDAGGAVETRHFDDLDMLRGVNDRWQLAQAGQLVRERILRRIAVGGVTIVDPTSTYIEFDVEVGVDTVIEPFTAILRGSRIGAGCRIGPNTRIESSLVSDGARVRMSCLEDAIVEVNASVGPFAHLRDR
ncbi:MAG: NTP transferase domain-containing protein, partial [Fimbriimonadaceae bacterium]